MNFDDFLRIFFTFSKLLRLLMIFSRVYHNFIQLTIIFSKNKSLNIMRRRVFN